MDMHTLHDHAWDVVVPGTAAGAAPGAVSGTAPTALGSAPTAPGTSEAARSGFQVFSLEQYAASHARAMHHPQGHQDRRDR